MFDILNELVKISPRYGVDEMKAAKVIIGELNSLQIPFVEEPFESSVPRTIKAELFADGVKIPCLGSSLVSGEIKDCQYLIGNFGYLGNKLPYNISYSPITDEISVVEFYREPSVTISRNSIVQIILAAEVRGVVEVKEEKFTTENILVGNILNPQSVLIAHFDSVIGNGALDNAAAVAVLFESIKSNPEILKNNLFIFSGNEEVSYDDYETKSGHGFRVFESLHENILRNAQQIIVVDGVGSSVPSFVQTGLDWVFQVKMINEIKDKVYWQKDDSEKALRIFHSKIDTVTNLQEKYLEEAKGCILKQLLLHL